MPQANLTDIQEMNIPILDGQSSSAAITVTHNLQDAAGDDLTPDRITVENTGLPTGGAMPGLTVVTPIMQRSTPEDGTFAIALIANNINISGATAQFPVRIISEYIHSIQSRDHTP